MTFLPVTPKFRPFIVLGLTHNEKRGYPPSARLLSEAYHSPCLLTNREIPTNELLKHPKVCIEGMVSLRSTQRGYIFQHTRGIILRIVFGKQSLMVVSDSQSTKHRVTLFHYVVSAWNVCCSSTGTMSGQYDCKITKCLGTSKES